MTVRYRCGQLNDLPLVCNLFDYGIGENDREFVIFFVYQNSVRAVMNVIVCSCPFLCLKGGNEW